MEKEIEFLGRNAEIAQSLRPRGRLALQRYCSKPHAMYRFALIEVLGKGILEAL